MDKQQDTGLVVSALAMAVTRREPDGNSTILHSDHGTQYTSWAFGKRIRDAGLLGSMGTAGDCYDNAMMESFWHTMQLELLDTRTWKIREELANAIFEWIECLYNPHTRHSSIGMHSPVTFEQHYRLVEEGDSDADGGPLPNLAPRKTPKTNLATIRKFLSQHPGAEAALTQRFGRYVQRVVFDDEGDVVDRARAGLYFSRWNRARQVEWIEILKQLWDRGLAVTDLSGEDEQIALLEVSHAAGVEADAILSALDSRFAAVRDRAGQYRSHLDDAGRAELRRTLLAHATRYPGASLRIIEDELAEDRPNAERWLLLVAALTLIEDRPKASTAEQVLRWLESGGPFERALESVPASEETRLKVRVTLRQWRSSDRYLFPALEALERIGLGAEVELLRSQRQQKTDRLFSGVGEQAEEVDVPVMTRATWELLQLELERLERELKTTIPATIQRARELGDLRENSEYHSAKLKQRRTSASSSPRSSCV
jgi:hypothetical protein